MNGTLFYAKIVEHYFIKLLTENISMFNVTYLKYYVGKNEWNFILCKNSGTLFCANFNEKSRKYMFSLINNFLADVII